MALLCTNRMPLSRAAVFMVVQLVAAVMATKAAGHFAGVEIASTFAGVDTDAPLLKSVWLEAFPIAVIVFILFQAAVATEAEGGVGPKLAGLYIGLAVFALASTFAPGIFNPALAFGRAFVLSSWKHHWIYWTPVPVAMLTALLCEHVFVAPAGGRAPNSWLAWISKRLDMLTVQLKALGTGALIAYGICNVLYYVPVLCFTLLRGVRLCPLFSA
jgi:branched-subunit amino acid transport protein